MRTQWTTNGNRDAGSSCLCDRGLHRYLQNFGGGFEHPKPPLSVRHCFQVSVVGTVSFRLCDWCFFVFAQFQLRFYSRVLYPDKNFMLYPVFNNVNTCCTSWDCCPRPSVRRWVTAPCNVRWFVPFLVLPLLAAQPATVSLAMVLVTTASSRCTAHCQFFLFSTWPTSTSKTQATGSSESW